MQFIAAIIVFFILKLLWDMYNQPKKTQKNRSRAGEVIDLSDAWIDLDNMPYQKREQLLKNGELSLYQLLNEILSDYNYQVYPKVRLADILILPSRADNRIQYLNRIQERNVDFLICKVPEFKPVLIVLVEGQAERKKKQLMNNFSKKAAEAAGLPCLQLSLNNLPPVDSLAKNLRTLGLDI